MSQLDDIKKLQDKIDEIKNTLSKNQALKEQLSFRKQEIVKLADSLGVEPVLESITAMIEDLSASISKAIDGMSSSLSDVEKEINKCL